MFFFFFTRCRLRRGILWIFILSLEGIVCATTVWRSSTRTSLLVSNQPQICPQILLLPLLSHRGNFYRCYSRLFPLRSPHSDLNCERKPCSAKCRGNFHRKRIASNQMKIDWFDRLRWLGPTDERFHNNALGPLVSLHYATKRTLIAFSQDDDRIYERKDIWWQEQPSLLSSLFVFRAEYGKPILALESMVAINSLRCKELTPTNMWLEWS